VLILSAAVGESHTEMARILAAELELRSDVEAVSIINDFSVLGPILDPALSRGFRFHLGEVQWSYNLVYGLFTRLTTARLAGERAL
jgi:hypothetical protein